MLDYLKYLRGILLRMVSVIGESKSWLDSVLLLSALVTWQSGLSFLREYDLSAWLAEYSHWLTGALIFLSASLAAYYEDKKKTNKIDTNEKRIKALENVYPQILVKPVLNNQRILVDVSTDAIAHTVDDIEVSAACESDRCRLRPTESIKFISLSSGQVIRFDLGLYNPSTQRITIGHPNYTDSFDLESGHHRIQLTAIGRHARPCNIEVIIDVVEGQLQIETLQPV